MGRIIIIVLMGLLLIGCSGKSLENNKISDNITKKEIENIEFTDQMFVVDYKIDNMDRGNHDYETVDKLIVVNPDSSTYKRGEVVYFKTPDYTNENPDLKLSEHQISRVVGLPGETVEIKKGQVYIDNKTLEAFYSQPTVLGLYKDDFLAKKIQDSLLTKKDFEESMDEVTVPKDSVFILGDQWWRSIDSRHFGVLPINKIEGKVLGYEK